MDQRAELIERRLEPAVIIAAILTIPALLLEDSARQGTAHTIGYIGNYLIWLTFLLEALVMLMVAPSRKRWIRDHPLDLAIVVFTPPFLFTAIQGLRVLRVLRLLRLFRLAPIMRRAFTVEGLQYISFLALLTLLAGAEAFASAENTSFGKALYWALTTMTTVGYGDITPHTSTGRIVASIMMVIGIGFFAILTGAIAQRFLTAEVVELEQHERDLVAQIRNITAQLRQLEQEVVRRR